MEELTGLQNIQFELKAPKNQKNSFGGYSYRSCEDVLEALKPLLQKHKCILTITDNIELIGDRFYVVATVMFVDSAGNKTESKAYAREPANKKGMDESQITGAASSYARKYALNALFLIDDVKDADTANEHGKGNENQPTPPQQIQGIKDITKFLEVWEGGKVYSDKYVYYNSQKFEATPDQVKLIKESTKYKPEQK